MIKICLIVPKFLPVPAVRGGAIETLMTNFIDQNEISQRLDITMVTPYDTCAIEAQSKYKYTNFINIKKGLFDDWLFMFYRIGRRFLKRYFIFFDQYEYKTFNSIKRVTFDLVINESSEFNAFYHLSKKIGKKRVAAHLHCEIVNKPLFEKTYGAIFTVSDYIKQRFLMAGNFDKNKVIPIHNGIVKSNFSKQVDIDVKNNLKKELSINDNDFVVIFSGRIVEIKGIEHLINAVIKLRKENVKLLIIGSPNFGNKGRSPFLERIEQMVRANSDIIRFTGFVQNTELYKYYNISDVAVIPSIYEDPAPLVPIEAMAAGMPIVATNSGGIWEFVDEKCALRLVKESNLEGQIVKSILYLKTNPSLMYKMSRHAIEKSKIYTSEYFYNNFCNKIEEICKY